MKLEKIWIFLRILTIVKRGPLTNSPKNRIGNLLAYYLLQRRLRPSVSGLNVMNSSLNSFDTCTAINVQITFDSTFDSGIFLFWLN